MRRTSRYLGTAMFAAALALPGGLPIGAAEPLPEPNAVESTLYFGMKSADGSGVSEQEWTHFLAEVITPRFPDGLTVVQVYGQAGNQRAKPDAVLAETTKMLIIVHPNTAEAANALGEIKAEYKARFNNLGVFHTDAPVRMVE
jgi:hypothetical protein